MKLGFAKQIQEFADKVPQIFELVWKWSAKDVVFEMQRPRNGKFHTGGASSAGGNMPVWTEFLRASLMASTSHMPPMIAGHRPKTMWTPYDYDPAPIHAVIEGAKLGQTLYFGYAADYAAFQNYGTSKFEGRRFRDLAAQKWPSIVAKNAAKARQMFGM